MSTFIKPVYFLVAGITLLMSFIIFFEYQRKAYQRPENFFEDTRELLDFRIRAMYAQGEAMLASYEAENQLEFYSLQRSATFDYFVFSSGKLSYWSDYDYVPEYSDVRGAYQVAFINNSYGQFVITKSRKVIQEKLVEVFTVLPLYRAYKFSNSFISSGYNSDLFSGSLQRIYDKTLPGGFDYVDPLQNEYLFTIQYDTSYSITGKPFQVWAMLWLAIAYLSLTIGIILIIKKFHRKRWYGRAWLIMALFLVLGVRGVMLWLNFPGALLYLPLFDSRYYAASIYAPSLGDLLLNSMVFAILVIYGGWVLKRKSWLALYLISNRYLRIALALLGLCLAYVVLSINYQLIQDLYFNSQLPIDITADISLESKKIAVYGIFSLNAVTIFLILHLLLMLVWHGLHKQKTLFYILQVLAVALFIWWGNRLEINVWLVAITGIIYFTLVIELRLYTYLVRFRYKSFIYLFLAGLTFSVLGGVAVYDGARFDLSNTKSRFAEQFLAERDGLAEYLLSELSQQIREDVFIKSRMFSPFSSKEIIKQKIRMVYLGNYFDKYEVRITLYNGNGEPFDQSINRTYTDYRNRLDREQYRTQYTNLFMIRDPLTETYSRYILFIPLERFNHPIGYISVECNLKKVIPQNDFPELLVNTAVQNPDPMIRQFQYGIYVDDHLILNSGIFNYPLSFSSDFGQYSDKLFSEGIITDGVHHLAFQSGPGKIIVVTSPFKPREIIAANISALFLVIILEVLVLMFIYILRIARTGAQLNYSTKIQLYLNLAFFVPSILISITIVSLLSNNYERELSQTYVERASRAVNDITSSYVRYTQNRMNGEELTGEVSELANISSTDINLYNLNGRLIASSSSQIYDNHVISSYINPEALLAIRYGYNNRIITEERVGDLDYQSVYTAIRSFDSGTLIGILSMPFFRSRMVLQQQLISVLNNMLIVFVTAFILFLIASYFVSGWLTKPLRLIAQRLSHTSLSGNEPIDWYTDDEIGLLVNEYNDMIVKLEASKLALARSEKESAWREMARQVAHEIKNPLTPMKLNLQHLHRIIDAEHLEKKKAAANIDSLIRQIDNLSDIVTSFSSFAQMPIPELSEMDLVQTVNDVVNLHKNTQGAEIHFKADRPSVKIMGDEKLMGRIVTNLILNAIQSVNGNETVQVEVEIKTYDRKVILQVSDNGEGIAEDIQEKVFLPNFSTKETGSGIGLAIAKRGIEYSGGKIWFESGAASGTTFYLELPLVS